MARTVSVTEILDKREIAAFTARSNGRGLLFLAAHLAVLMLGGVAIRAALGTIWLAPLLVLHGLVVVHLFAPLHETVHFTAFRSRWLNLAVGIPCALAIGVPFLFFRLEHLAHHRFTQDPERDPELIPIGKRLRDHFWYISTVPYWKNLLGDLARHAVGHCRKEERAFLSAEQQRRATWEARAMITCYAAVLIASLAMQSWAAVLYWLLPRVLGEPFMRVIRVSEHVGCDDGLDMLANTRTVAHAAAPIRWLAWNMCWHTAHHYFPGVPFHRLPAFHAAVADRVKYLSPDYASAHRDILGRIRAQGRVANAGSSNAVTGGGVPSNRAISTRQV
jgi:fatty acid desaturase